MRVSRLQEQIDRGEYHVDAHAVADALIRRLLQGPPPPPAQPECS